MATDKMQTGGFRAAEHKQLGDIRLWDREGKAVSEANVKLTAALFVCRTRETSSDFLQFLVVKFCLMTS